MKRFNNEYRVVDCDSGHRVVSADYIERHANGDISFYKVGVDQSTSELVSHFKAPVLVNLMNKKNTPQNLKGANNDK